MFDSDRMTDWEFVFDGVVGFLTSPMWNVPIVTFIEKNCIVFEPNDENEFTYTEIHKEYSALVEELLTSYLKDVGITEEQFVLACEAGSNDSSRVPDRSIFEQVWAGEDFDLFKKIMVKKNLDLELQALHMIQQRNGVVPDVFVSESNKSLKKSRSKHLTDEEKLLQEVMAQSQEEYDKEKGKRREIERMEKTLALSKEESERLHELAERELNELERMVSLSLKLEKHSAPKTKECSKSKPGPSSQKGKGNVGNAKSASKPSSKETPKKASKSEAQTSTPSTGSVQTKPSAAKQNCEPPSTLKEKTGPVTDVTKPAMSSAGKNETQTSSPSAEQASTSTANQRSAASVTELKPPSLKVQMTPAEAAADWILSAKVEAGAPSSKSSNDSKSDDKTPEEDEIMKRAKYMRMQREKLLNLKKQERAKRLQTFEQEQPVKRPMSSRVARRVTQGNEAEKPLTNEDSEKEQKMLAMRRALAERLKKEVVNKHFEKNGK